MSVLGPILAFLTISALWKVATNLTATEIAWTLGVIFGLVVLAASIVFNIWPVLLVVSLLLFSWGIKGLFEVAVTDGIRKGRG